MRRMLDADILVVGGGISGLCTASLLQKDGYSVRVLEASERVGGRVRLESVGEGFAPVEVGGEFMHEKCVYDEIFPGNDWKIHKLITWAQGDGTAHYRPDQLTLYWIEGQKRLINSVDFSTVLLDRFGQVKQQIPANTEDTMVKEIQQSIQFMDDAEELDYRSIPRDLTVEQYLKQNLKLKNPEVFDLFNAGFSNTYCSNSKELKMRDVVYYTSLFQEDHDAEMRLDLGFSRTVLPALLKGVDVVKNWEVSKIDYTNEGVTLTSKDGRIVAGKKVVVTPTHQCVMDITFNPPLPSPFRQAVESIKLDNAVKIILVYSSVFWPKELHGMICSGSVIPEIWFIKRSPTDFAVVGFTTSICANKIQQMGEKQDNSAVTNSIESKATKEMVDQLNRMFGKGKKPADNYVKSVYYDWSSNPFVRGGYMCVLPDKTRDALFSFRHNSLIFAGESYGKAFSSVGAALESAQRARKLISNKAKL